MRRSWAVVAAALVSIAVVAAPAGADPVSLDEWRARLVAAAEDPSSTSAVGLVAGTTEVVLPDGTRLPVEESSLRALAVDQRRARLSTLRSSADRLAHTRGATAQEREAASAALRRGEFDELAGFDTPSWIERVLRFLRRSLARTFDPDLSTAGGRVQLAVGLVMLVAVMVLAVRLLRRGTTVGPPDVADPAEAAREEPSEALWRRRFCEARASGDATEALRCLYLAALLHLDDAGVVDFRPGRTDALYLLELAERAPAAVERFRALSEAFSRSHYGGEDVDDAGVAAAEAAEAGLRAALTRSAA